MGRLSVEESDLFDGDNRLHERLFKMTRLIAEWFDLVSRLDGGPIQGDGGGCGVVPG